MRINQIQKLLKDYRLDAWLIYQYQGTDKDGLNPIADEVCGIKELVTRPWYCLIKKSEKTPTWILQSMEKDKFTHLRGKKMIYSSRNSLIEILKKALPKTGKVAMEITEKANIPALSRVDHGTITLIKSLTKAQIISSQDLVGAYLSKWGRRGLDSHKQTVKALVKILESVKQKVSQNLGQITDYELQILIEKQYQKHKLTSLYHPIVAVGVDTGNPHYFPTLNSAKKIKKDQLLLIDIWGKTRQAGSIYADITTMYYTGKIIPPEIQKAWEKLILARDAVLGYLLKNSKTSGGKLDRIARDILEKEGYGQYFIHRTGHNLSGELHGWGPNLDSYETKDDRQLLLDTGYSIEPGIYTSKFGLRSEINIYLHPNGKVETTTPVPKEIQKIQ